MLFGPFGADLRAELPRLNAELRRDYDTSPELRTGDKPVTAIDAWLAVGDALNTGARLERDCWDDYPALVLNGGADGRASDEFDLTPFVPGARRAVAGRGDHAAAPGDPLFQGEIVR